MWCLCSEKKTYKTLPRTNEKIYGRCAFGKDCNWLPETEKRDRYILVIADYFTKWTVPIPDQEAATVASALIDRFIRVFGIPNEIHSDQGTNFESILFHEICDLLNMEKTRITPFRPKSDGMVERANQTIQNMLTAFIDPMQRDWDMFLSVVMMV